MPLPQFKDTVYNVSDSGVEITTLTIQRFIDDCSKNGGGKVIVPKGEYSDIGKIELGVYPLGIHVHRQRDDIYVTSTLAVAK